MAGGQCRQVFKQGGCRVGLLLADQCSCQCTELLGRQRHIAVQGQLQQGGEISGKTVIEMRVTEELARDILFSLLLLQRRDDALICQRHGGEVQARTLLLGDDAIPVLILFEQLCQRRQFTAEG